MSKKESVPKTPIHGRSLADLFPEIAAQADGWDPTTVSAGSNHKASWVCEREHKWEAIVGARTGQSQGCPYCAGRRAWPGFNDLATVRPDVAARAAGWDPTTVTQGSHYVGEWRCDVGHIWKAQVKAVVIGQGCAVCAGQQVQEGVNDLRTLFPAIANELVNRDEYLVAANSHRLLRWRCALNHEWEERVHKRTRRGDSCPYCSGHRLLAGFNDVASRRPEIVGEVDGWDPTEVYYRSDVQFKWRCKEGHRWKTSAEMRAYLGSDCPTCNNFRVEVGVNDLATTHPELAAQAVGWDPRIYLAGSSSSPLLWRCDLGHEWKTTIDSRAGKASGCPFCAYKQVLPGFNDLATTHQHLVDEVDGWDPTIVIAGTNKVLSWKCAFGHTWKTKGTTRASRTERANGVSGCPSCAKSGFDPNKDGYLYFLEHHDWEMYQIGITNSPKDRLASHMKLGWTVREVRGPMDGHLTNDLETGILRALKKRGAVFANRAGGLKFDGWSEAWAAPSFAASSLSGLIELVYEDDLVNTTRTLDQR